MSPTYPHSLAGVKIIFAMRMIKNIKMIINNFIKGLIVLSQMKCLKLKRLRMPENKSNVFK